MRAVCGVLVCVRSRDPPRRRAAIQECLGGGARLRGAAARFLCGPSVTNCCRGAKNFAAAAAQRARAPQRRSRGCAEAALRSRRVRAPPVGSKRHKVLFESQGLYHARASCKGAGFAVRAQRGTFGGSVRSLQVSGAPRCAFKSFSVCFEQFASDGVCRGCVKGSPDRTLAGALGP